MRLLNVTPHYRPQTKTMSTYRKIQVGVQHAIRLQPLRFRGEVMEVSDMTART